MDSPGNNSSSIRGVAGRKGLSRYKTPTQMRQDYKRLDALFEDYENYKRKRALHVIMVSIILVLIFLQVCFSVRIYKAVEKNLIFELQELLNINKKPMVLLQDLSQMDSEHINSIILMGIFTFMYGYDYMIGMGILCKYLIGMIIFKFVSYCMQEPRPFWLGELGPKRTLTNDIVGYSCDNTFGMPDLSIIQLFWFLINFQDIMKKAQIKLRMVIDKVLIWGGLLLLIYTIVLKYISGHIFILQAVMALLLGLILLQLSKYYTGYMRKAIERCTVGASLEKKYIVRYYVGLMIVAIVDVVLLIVNDSYNHKQLQYLENIVLSAHNVAQLQILSQ